MLTRDDFVSLGDGGFGNPRSRVAHAMAWFRNELYLGVTHSRGERPEDAARILRFDADRVRWDAVHVSPLIAADARATATDVYRGRKGERRRASRNSPTPSGEHLVPRDRGYRSMITFQGRDDPEPVLYVGTLSQVGASLLRSSDGKNFTTLPGPGTAGGSRTTLSFRGLAAFGDRLFAAPAGSVDAQTMDRNFGDRPELYVTENPVIGEWHSALPEEFGDPGDRSVFSMTVFANHLYISTGNPQRGFSLWKTRAQGDPPFDWQPVIVDGAGRFNLNETAATLCPFNGALYVGSGLPGLGYDKANDVGPAAFELLRVFPDDSWDLLAGTPRFTPNGLKVPLATHGPGFDDPYNSVVWSMTAHENALYLGTHQWEPFDIALKGKTPMQGGFQLWGSEDGESWTRILDQGHGDPLQTGVRTLLSTPLGLALGTSNHQEIERRWRRSTHSSAETSGEGGCAVWLGVV
jgi:hypothetical protein